MAPNIDGCADRTSLQNLASGSAPPSTGNQTKRAERPWRAVVFIFVAVAAALTGLHLHRAAAPQTPSTITGRNDTLTLTVYESDSDIRLNVALAVSIGKHTSHAALYVSADVPRGKHDDVLLMANLPSTRGKSVAQNTFTRNPQRFEPVPKNYVPNSANEPDSVNTQPFHLLLRDFHGQDGVTRNPLSNLFGVPLASFKLPKAAAANSDGGVDVHMPRLAFEETGDQGAAAWATTDANETSSSISGGMFQINHDNDKGNAYRARDIAMSNGKPVAAIYHQPKHLWDTEYLYQDGLSLATEKIDVNVPSTGTLSNFGFTWHGHGSLEPVLITSGADAESTRERDEFLSGVALATAAAALVALLQERQVPTCFRWPRQGTRWLYRRTVASGRLAVRAVATFDWARPARTFKNAADTRFADWGDSSDSDC